MTCNPRFSDPSYRSELIDILESLIHTARHSEVAFDPRSAFGTVSISCPDKRMQLKGLGMLVLEDPSVTELQTLEEAAQKQWLKDEINAIKHGHQDLWRLEVFVNPMVVPFDSDLATDLAGVVSHAARGLPNSVRRFKDVSPLAADDALLKYKKEYMVSRLKGDELYETIDASAFCKLVEVAATRDLDKPDLFIDLWESEYNAMLNQYSRPQ